MEKVTRTKRPNLWDVVSQEDYQQALDAGHIRTQTHPELPYLIHNYTERCTWEQAWNQATLACRGLVTHAETNEVLARPYPKFFNHGQPGAPVIGLDDEVLVTDKADGSLAILVSTPGGEHIIATRGSFASDQARWATEFYRSNHAPHFVPNPDWTYLYEIVYPENRVVVDYGDTEALILLGAVEIASGRSIHVEEAAQGWNGPTVEVFPHTTLREVLEAPERPNAEGFVLWHPETDTRMKIKYADYVRLHKWLTNTTEKHVWEVLSTGENPDEVFAGAPDEFHEWLKEVVAKLRHGYAAARAEAENAHRELLAQLPESFTRKDYAQKAAQHPKKSVLFLLLDGKDIDEYLWRELRPTGTHTVRNVDSAAD